MMRKSGEHPFVSIIMPVHNEALFIERSVGALLRQTYPTDRMEIIIADGQSSDNTSQIVKGIADKSKTPIRLVDNPRCIASTGLNAAIKKATGEIIVRVDGHTIVEPDYVNECVRALTATDSCNVGGRMQAVSSGLVGSAISLATSSPFGIGNGRFHYSQQEQFVDTVYLGAWWKEVFDKYGLFNEDLVRNQDDEFNYRLRSNGCRILLTPRIKSRYYNRNSIPRLWRQYFQYGYWKVRVLQLHPRQMRLRQFVPFIFVASLILFGIFSMFSTIGRWMLAAMIVSYLLANIGAAIYTAKAKLALIPFISLSFLVLHISYGFGWLLGLIAFRNRWR